MASIIVVGAGFSGMSVAARLAKLRHEVTVIDSGRSAGGKLLGLRANGESWSTAPPSVTLPGVFRDLFRKSGRPMSAILDMQASGPRRHVFLGHRQLTLDLPFGTRSSQHDALVETFGNDPWSPWLDELAEPWDIVRRHVFERISTLDDVENVGDRINLRQSLQQAVRRELKHRTMARVALDSWRQMGFDTKSLPSIWNVWHYVERNFGRWHFDGDTEGLAAALVQRLGERKVTIELETPVRGVSMKFGRVIGVETESGVREADVVVWASGQLLPVLGLPAFPSPNIELTGIALLEDQLPDDLVVHGRGTNMRIWRSGHRRWVSAAPVGTDVRGVLRMLRVPDADVLGLIPLTSDQKQRKQQVSATGSGLGLDLDTRTPTKGQRKSKAVWVPRPAIAPVEGLYVIGNSAVPGGSLELTGMGTAAVAEAIGPAARVSLVTENDSDETL